MDTPMYVLNRVPHKYTTYTLICYKRNFPTCDLHPMNLKNALPTCKFTLQIFQKFPAYTFIQV